MKITFRHNARELAEKFRAAATVMAGYIRVTIDLEDRSLTIIYWQAVNHGRDALEAFGDIDDGEIEQLEGEAMEVAVAYPGQTRAVRRELAEAFGELLRRYLVAGIDDEDLIDTGRLRRDALSAPLIIEGA